MEEESIETGVCENPETADSKMPQDRQRLYEQSRDREMINEAIGC